MTQETSPTGTGESATRAEAMTALLSAGDPDHLALIVPDSGQVMTYAQVTGQIEALAQRLAGLGVRSGDKVAMCLPNGPDVVLLLLAITMLGAAAAPLNPAYTEPEFAFYLGDILPRLLLVPAGGAAAATAAAMTGDTSVVGVHANVDGPPELLGPGGPAAPQRSAPAVRSSRHEGSPPTGSGHRPASTARPGCRLARRCTR